MESNEVKTRLSHNILVYEASASVDYKYGPYSSVTQAISTLGPEGYNVITKGLTIAIIEDGKIVEYQWKNGVADSDLVKKASDIDASIKDGTITIGSETITPATLVDGKVPSTQLPSYVDDVLEYSAYADFPTTGETGKIYIDTSTNYTYRWSGSTYVQISSKSFSVNTSYPRMEITEGDNKYIVALTKLVTPAKTGINATNINVVSGGNAVFTLTCATSGATIYYKLYTSKPATDPTATDITTQGSTVTISNFTGTAVTTYYIYTKTMLNGEVSDVNCHTVTVTPKCATPSISASGSQYSTSRTITISCNTSGVTIYYTTDGTTPTTSSTAYNASEKPTISASCTVKALAVKTGYANSGVASQSYTVGTLYMYEGLVDDTPTAIPGTLTAVEDDALPLVYAIPSTETEQKKVCIAYDKSYGDLTSINDDNGTQYLGNFTKSVIGSYNVYCMNAKANQAGITYTFSK